jgi:diguanylate cyclase
VPFEQLFDMVDAGLVVLDTEFRVTHWNRWMEFQANVEKADIVGHSLFEFFPKLDVAWFRRSCTAVLHFGNFAFFSQKLHGYCFPFRLHSSSHPDIEFMQQDVQVGPIRAVDPGAQVAITHIYLMVRDVTEVTVIEKRLKEAANRDGLTGLFGRRYLEERLTDEVARFKRYGRPFSVIMLDIDFFKDLNDNYGHVFGDFVLRRLAQILRDGVRSSDIAARYGGEEFALILPETDLDPAVSMAEKIRRTIEEAEFARGEIRAEVTASFGVTGCKADIDHVHELIERADEALYMAKDDGRNAVRVLS